MMLSKEIVNGVPIGSDAVFLQAHVGFSLSYHRQFFFILSAQTLVKAQLLVFELRSLRPILK